MAKPVLLAVVLLYALLVLPGLAGVQLRRNRRREDDAVIDAWVARYSGHPPGSLGHEAMTLAVRMRELGRRSQAADSLRRLDATFETSFDAALPALFRELGIDPARTRRLT